MDFSILAILYQNVLILKNQQNDVIKVSVFSHFVKKLFLTMSLNFDQHLVRI